MNLVGNRLRYRFTDTPILEGISIHETANSVVILVATVSSVHCLSYKHPDKILVQASYVFTRSNLFKHVVETKLD